MGTEPIMQSCATCPTFSSCNRNIWPVCNNVLVNRRAYYTKHEEEDELNRDISQKDWERMKIA